MARQCFRGAGGVGAIVRPYHLQPAAGECAVTALSQPVFMDGDRRTEGALAIVASSVLVVVGLLVAGWTLVG